MDVESNTLGLSGERRRISTLLSGPANALRRVLESIKAGKRLPEARFANLKLAARGQGSVHGSFMAKGTDTSGQLPPAPGGR